MNTAKFQKHLGFPSGEMALTIMRIVDGVEVSLVRSLTASRWTFLIDKEGRIVHKNMAVWAEDDSKNILETI